MKLVLLCVLSSGFLTVSAQEPPESDVDIPALKAAIADLTATFPKRYPKRFQARTKRLGSMKEAECKVFAREALLANPLLQDYPVLFVTRKQYRRDHHNTATIFQQGEINTGSYEPPGQIKLLDLKTGHVKTLVDAGPTGIARDPELSWDGAKIVFRCGPAKRTTTIFMNTIWKRRSRSR